MQVAIKIKNLPQVRAALAKSPKIVSKHINKAIKESIWDIHNSAKDLVPVDTGNLSSSITRGVRVSNLRGEIRPVAKYAYWVEVLPYKHRVGQSHYLQGAVDKSGNKINKYFGKGLKNALSEVARSAGGH